MESTNKQTSGRMMSTLSSGNLVMVMPEGKDGPVHTLQRDLLLPCGFLPYCTCTYDRQECQTASGQELCLLCYSPLPVHQSLKHSSQYKLTSPPCDIRQSDAPDVSSAFVPFNLLAVELPAEDREGKISMQNFPDPSEQIN